MSHLKLNCLFLASFAFTPFLQAEYPQPEAAYPAHGYTWENNTLGMDAVVPPPWTPLHSANETVECWGRSYEFNGGPWPAQIMSQGKPIFAAPPKLVCRVDGHELETTGGTVTRTVQGADRDVRHWETKVGAHRVTVTTSLEYDGFLHLALRLEPEKEATIEQLTWEFALPKEQASILNRYLEYDFETQHVNHDDDLGAARHVTGPIQMRFVPSVWLGNHEVGVEWACETNAGWSPLKSPAAIEVIPGEKSTLLRINAIVAPRRVSGAIELSFALLPTPVKPRPVGWRRWRLTTSLAGADGYDKADKVIGYAMGYPVKFRGLPANVPRSEDSVRDMERERALAAKSHARLIPYGALYALPARLPEGEWKDYAGTWRVDPHGGSVANANWAGGLGLPKGAESLIYICPSQRSLQDFFVWHYVHALENDHIGGTYFDVASQNYACLSPGHQHAGPREEGWEYFPLFSQRRLMQRLYVACRARDPGFLITQHCAMQAAVTTTFTDVVIKGEALNRTFKKPGASIAQAAKDPTAYIPDYGALPPDYFEVTYGPQQGAVLMLLPQVTKWCTELMAHDDARRTGFTRRMLARAAVMDVPVLNSMADRPLMMKVDQAKVRSGIADGAEFHGPWESASYLRQGGNKLTAGVYLKTKDHAAALVVANLSAERVQESFLLNATALPAHGLQPGGKATVIDVFTGEEQSFPGDAPVPLDLAPDELRMVVWE
jgi:hypothetical protein